MALKLRAKKALGAAPGTSGEPEKPRKQKAAKEEEALVESSPLGNGMELNEELEDHIARTVVITLANIFSQLAGMTEVVDAAVAAEEESEDSAEEEEEEAPEPPKKKRGKKKKEEEVADDDDEDEAPPTPKNKKKAPEPEEDESEDADDDEEDVVDDEDDDSDFDPNPFPKTLMELAEVAVEELDNDAKDIKAILETYLESAPEDAPATVKIAKLVEGKKMQAAWHHLVCLLIDDEGNVHDFNEAYVRNESYVYLGGVEGIPVEDTGFTVQKGAKLVSLADGSESKAPKGMKFAQIVHNPVQDTYFGINEDMDAIVQVVEA